MRRVMSTRSTRRGARATTSAEAALRFADELAHACAGALGTTVAGVILHGSLTLDDYVPGRSDLDLLVVIDDPLGDARLAALVEAVASRRAAAPGPVDLGWSPGRLPPRRPRRRRWRPTCASPPGPGSGWRSAGTPPSATWQWSSRCAVRTAAACWVRRRPS